MKIAVLGAGGMLGHKMYSVLSAAFPQTTAVFRKCPAHYVHLDLFDEKKTRGAFDGRKLDELEIYLSSLKADVLINCIGVTTRKLGPLGDSDIILVNSVLPQRLKEWSLRNGRKLIHFSTDCVYSGKGGPYAPGSPRDAKDLYGQSKAIGEVEGDGVLTIRSSIIGLEIEARTELLEWFLAQKGKAVRGFSNVMYSGVTTTQMAHTVRDLLKSGQSFSGIQQLASEPISKFALLSLANEIFGVRAKIEAVAEPASNKVLIPSPFFAERGLQVPSWRSQLEILKKELPQYERWSNHVEKQQAS